MGLTRIQRPRLVLAILMVVAFIPASALVYLQYRSLSQAQEHMQQALYANLKQALIGVRVEAGNDFLLWHRRPLIGLEIHEWLRHRDIEGMRSVAELTLRICPQLSLFFGYRNVPGTPVEVFVFRPGPMRRMQYHRDDGADTAIQELVSQLAETTSHWYTSFREIAGDRQQVFLHMVDDDPVETKEPHLGKIGYYGFAVSEGTLAHRYFPRLLDKHLERMTLPEEHPEAKPITAIFDQNGRQLSISHQSDTGFEVEESIGLVPGWTIRAGFPPGALKEFDRAQFVQGIGVVVVITGLLLVAIAFLAMTAAREMELSRARTEFAASVSHELKTPLSLIRGFVETLHMNRVGHPSQREEYFRIIESEIGRLSSMIDRILDISKIDVGLKRYQPEPVDIAALIEDTLASFSNELERNSFTLESHIESSLPIVRVDPQAFSQALMNLLSNAVKYSEQDRRITVRAVRSNGRLEIAVSDCGIGVPRREQGRIFERFYRSGRVSGKATGAGLGLALVKHFAKAHGGDVTVASAAGQGSTFTIHLPLPN